MLCLKKKKFWGSSSSYGPQNQSKSFGLEQGTTTDSGKRRLSRENSRAGEMAPPPSVLTNMPPVVREVTEDTPPDLLEGTMDLRVILPSGKAVQTTVDRKTPMMDLLIHAATSNKINPAGHIVQVRNERGIELPYKPSTPIGALDTTTIEIVPKNRVNEYIIVKKPSKVANQPFETTFRLQVHLPRNQLYVMRISPKTLLDEILHEVCQEKNLDISKYEIRHPVNLDQKLSLSLTVGDTGLQELTVVSKNSKINSSVSTADIMALQQSDKGCLDGGFKHSRSSVGDSSVSSESTASGRGISPCRSEDSRSISPLPLIRPKTLFNSRTMSNISTCSSSGISSEVHKSNTLNSSMPSQLSNQQVVMQAPPRTKKRAAPQPPSTPGSKPNSLNSSVVSHAPSPTHENGETCSTPDISANIHRQNGTSLERPIPRKKEAPKEPPKQHPPLSHHQSLPINQNRYNSGNINCHNQIEGGSSTLPVVNESRLVGRVSHPATTTNRMSNTISSSMTNLTSVSSASSSSLASSTGGLPKKRRAPKPPPLVQPPTQIEEELTNTDSETSTLHCELGKTPSERVRREDALSASSVSSLSSASEPLGPNTTKFSTKSKSTSSIEKMNRQGSGNVDNDGIERVETKEVGEVYDRNGSSYSRSSSTPSPSNSSNIAPPASPPSVRSRNLSSSNSVVDVDGTVPSSRPPSTNTQVLSSTSKPVSQQMPVPIPRRKAPTPPTNKTMNEKMPSNIMSREPVKNEMPLPKPRSDRKSMDSLASQSTGEARPKPSKSISVESSSNNGFSSPDDDGSFEKDVVAPPVLLSGQLRNPLAKYGVKVLPDNVLKERAERLKKSSSSGTSAEFPSNETTNKSSSPVRAATEQTNETYALKDDAQSHHKLVTAKVPIHQASKSYYSSSFDTTEEYSDSGLGTSLSANKHSVTTIKPTPIPPKSDYNTSQGSIRNLKQLTPSIGGSSVESDILDKDEYDSDNLEENLDFFEPSYRNSRRQQHNNSSVTAAAAKPPVISRDRSLTKSVSSPSVVPSQGRNEANKTKQSDAVPPPIKPRVVSNTQPFESSVNSDLKGSSSITTRLGNDTEIDAKLNRWQNMTSLNTIEKDAKNRPVVPSRTGGSSNRPLLLHADYPTTKKTEESQNEAACHSSESEASYTDSGVPATATVTPSPVNLDDVSLDQEFHERLLTEKLPSEDAELEDVKDSSRRSSIQSDHGEEWMNAVEAKMSKNDETMDKMIEAVLTNPTSPLSFEKENESNDESIESVELPEKIEIKKNELEETTYAEELCLTPEQKQSSEIDDSELSELIENSATDAPVRKLSKSESFTHNSEFNEAKERRRNFHTGRSNALQRSSASGGGSFTDLTSSLAASSMPECSHESESDGYTSNTSEFRNIENNKETSAQRSNVRGDGRTVSMNNVTTTEVSKDKDNNQSLNRKSVSTQQISKESTQLDKEKELEEYKQKLEREFEERMQEFLKQNATSTGSQAKANAASEQAGITENTEAIENSEAVKDEVLSKSHKSDESFKSLEESNEVHQQQIVQEQIEVAEVETCTPVLSFNEREKADEQIREPAKKESEMNGNVNPKVVLRKKPTQQERSIVIQTGPPTIKMSSWNEGPRRQVSVKKDDDYIMGFGQQDANAKATNNSARIHSFHGGPVVSVTQSQEDTKLKRESSPNPTTTSSAKGWSVLINAPNVMPNPNGAVRSVLSAWKQKMEETENEKVKSKEGPPAEIDIYGNTDSQEKSVKNSFQNVNSKTEKTSPEKKSSSSTTATPPIVQEKSMTIGSSFLRSEKPVTFTISHMDSNTLPRNKPAPVSKNNVDVVDAKSNTPSPSVDIRESATSLQDKKKFFQGIKPVENSGKEAPIPAANMKSNIAAISKVFEKQRVTKMQQMGSQQSLNSSDGAVSPASTLPRNDVVESKRFSNSFHRKNSSESQSSSIDNSVVLRVSQNTSSGKASPQPSANEMVHKLFGRPNSFTIDQTRRTPSPISSTTSTLSSSTSYDRFTPSPTVIDGPNNTVRISTMYKPSTASDQSNNIRSVGNKAIIIVNGEDNARKNPVKETKKNVSSKNEGNNNIAAAGDIKVGKLPISSMYVSAIAQQQQGKREPVPPPTTTNKEMSSDLTIIEKNSRNVKSTGVPPPPPPPLPSADAVIKPSLSLDVKKSPTNASSGGSNSKPTTPSSPVSPDPRAEIFNAIKNSNGNFGLKKTGSSFLLK